MYSALALLLSLTTQLGPTELADAGPETDTESAANTELAPAQTEAPALRPPARPIEVKCSLECRVYLDGQRVYPADLQGLSSGVHHLRIEAEDGSLAPAHHDLVLTSGDSPLVLRYGPSTSQPPPVASSHDRPPPRLTAKTYHRSHELMRAGGISMTTGALLLVGGAAVFVGGVWGTDDLGLSLGAMLASGVFLGPGGLICLIVGGSLYGAGKHRLNHPERARLRATPLVGLGPNGARVGFALEF